MKIIDNFLPQEDLNLLINTVNGPDFPWFYALRLNPNDTSLHSYWLHTLYINNNVTSDFYHLFYNHFVRKLPDFLALTRLRLVLYTVTPEIVEHASHVDFDSKNVEGALLYLNSNDGFTRLHDGQKVDSVKNRLLIHDSWRKHNSTSCTNEKFRVVLVANYVKTEGV